MKEVGGKRGVWRGLHLGVNWSRGEIPHWNNRLGQRRSTWGCWTVRQLICDCLNGMRITQTIFAAAIRTLNRDAGWLDQIWMIQIFVTPRTTACQATPSITNCQSLLKLISIELVMPSNHPVPFSSCLQAFPASGSFPMGQSSHQVAKVLEPQLEHQSLLHLLSQSQSCLLFLISPDFLLLHSSPLWWKRTTFLV